MTRINIIDPSLLLDEHLIAEWRELPRIPNSILNNKAKIVLKDIPDQYRLGSGHVKFWYNKLEYLRKRHDLLCSEMDKRGIKRNPTYRVNLDGLQPILKLCLCNDYTPTENALQLNIERIQERFDLRKRAYHMSEQYTGVKHTIDSEHGFNQYLKKIESYYKL